MYTYIYILCTVSVCMALINATSSQQASSPERDNFGDLLRKADNVENIKDKFSHELSDLKKDITNDKLKANY